MVKFIKNIIKYFIVSKLLLETLFYKVPQAFLNKTDNYFGLELKLDNNAIVAKSQFYSSTQNATYFKYRAVVLR